MHRTTRPLCLPIIGLLAILALPGCNDPISRDAAEVRLARIEHRLQQVAEREAEGPARVRETLDIAARFERRHAARNRENAELLAGLWDDELARWDRRQPEIERFLAEQLAGDMDRATWAAHAMFD